MRLECLPRSLFPAVWKTVSPRTLAESSPRLGFSLCVSLAQSFRRGPRPVTSDSSASAWGLSAPVVDTVSRAGAGLTTVASLIYSGLLGFRGHSWKHRLRGPKGAVGQRGIRQGQGLRGTPEWSGPPHSETVALRKRRGGAPASGYTGRPPCPPAEGARPQQQHPCGVSLDREEAFRSPERISGFLGVHCGAAQSKAGYPPSERCVRLTEGSA